MTRRDKPSTSGVRYEFDELNRLIIHDPLDAAQPRRVVDGDVRIDRDNRLLYRVRAKPQPDGRPPEQDYAFDGTWRLTDEHQLALALHERDTGEQQELFLKGALVEAKSNALAVSLARSARSGQRGSQRVSLSGRWQADERNRLTFLVEKAQGEADVLVFDGAWSVGGRHEVRYDYRRRQTRRRDAALHTLRFSGTWDVADSSQLVYRLDTQGRSVFAFQAALQSRSLNARDGKLAYQIGIRLSDGRDVRRTVALFGIWKLNRDLSVAFEVPYADGRRQAITFRGTSTLAARNRLTVALASRRGDPLELSVTFSRAFLDDAEWFLRLQRRGEDAQLLGGVRVRF